MHMLMTKTILPCTKRPNDGLTPLGRLMVNHEKWGGQIVAPQLDSSLITVKDLFIPHTKIWNKELINQNFLPWEAESIQSIPVSYCPMEDLLIWPRTRDGSYSVKSAYQLLSAENRTSQPSSSDTEACKPFWNSIWKLKVPKKDKHFLWKASNESLPTKCNLFTRHILPDNVFTFCDKHPEDTIHSLWLCDLVKCIWLSDPIFSLPQSKNFRSFGDLVSAVLSDTSPATTTLFSIVAWSIWIRRNKLWEKQHVWEVGETIQWLENCCYNSRMFRDVHLGLLLGAHGRSGRLQV
nr:putative ribonuclease h protein [Quercus suber]